MPKFINMKNLLLFFVSILCLNCSEQKNAQNLQNDQVVAQEIEETPVDGPGFIYRSLSGPDDFTIEGPHRFQTIGGRKGFRPTSLKTKAFIKTELQKSPKGTLTFWFSPMEDNKISRGFLSMPSELVYPLVSDHFPQREDDKMRFGVYWNGANYPSLIGRFQSGRYWTIMDEGVAPVVYADYLRLRQGQWYFVALTWNKPDSKLEIFVNGKLVGHHLHAKGFEIPGDTLYLGNPLMVISELTLQDQVLDESQISKEYARLRPGTNDLSDEDIRHIAGPVEKPPLDVQREEGWKETYRCDFTSQEDIDEWTFQTGDKYRDQFELNITDEGLYWRTPDVVDVESRGYLWCPKWFEGDQWIEYDFRLESPKGLALLIICAGGMQGEDVIYDHGLLNTGSMGPMLSRYRNYHWEYMRRVEAMREDVETQYVNKNPWGKSLHVGCFPRLKNDVWHRMRLVKIGHRLHGSIDGQTVFDITDDPFDNNGPVFNSGRIVLRQMYHTAMSYRNFVVYQRP